jgi:DNA polymerase-1
MSGSIINLINDIIELGKASKIVDTFVPAFENKSITKKDGRAYLHGSFNLGGTVSGRLSSSKPNLQQIPSSGSIYAKPVKKCFQAPDGWLMVGADFSSLEDRIDALLTKDTNKIKVYTDGYDGHSLRAYYYFKDKIPDIDPTSVESINSIASKYKKFRQDSKAPTFALTYGGTYHTLINNCGFNESTAKDIEANYHELYKESDIYKQRRVKEASEKGYAEVAFGLRVRTPVLKQVLWGSSKVPYEAMAESRTVGNAMGQSYGMLTNRAANEVMERVWASEYAEQILIISQIHDSIYFLVKAEPKILKFINDNLIECMEWQDLPEIDHPTVRLGAELEVFYPSWATPMPLENKASLEACEELLWAINFHKGLNHEAPKG